MSFVEPFPTEAVRAIASACMVDFDQLANDVDRLRLIYRPIHSALELAAWLCALRLLTGSASAAVRAYEDIRWAHLRLQRVGEPDLPSVERANPRVRAEIHRLMAIGRAADAEAAS